MSLRIVISLAIAAFVVVFTLQNAAQVPLNFAIWHFETPLALVVVLTLILGAIAAALVAAPASLRKSWKLAREERHRSLLDQRIRELEQSVAAKDRRIRELEARGEAAPANVPPPALPL